MWPASQAQLCGRNVLCRALSLPFTVFYMVSALLYLGCLRVAHVESTFLIIGGRRRRE